MCLFSQNELGLTDCRDIPQLYFRAEYSARDPDLKDNWRGKGRQDIIQEAEIKTVNILYMCVSNLVMVQIF